MKKYLISTLVLIYFISCKETINEAIDSKIYAPLDEIEISEGNVWIPTTVLPDTGDTIHYVKTLDIAVNDSNYIFVATDFAGVFRSKNEGITWTTQNNGFNIRGSINSTDLYFTSAISCLDKYIFVGTDSSIYISENIGNSWSLTKKWNDYKYIDLFKPKNKGEMYAGCYNGVVKTDDFGKNWKDISTNFNWDSRGYAYDLEFTKDGTLYIATAKGLARTYNDGGDWEYLGIQDQTLDVEVSEKGFIYAAIYNKLYLSKDDGKNWVSIFDEDSFIECILVNKANTIFICCYKGVYRSKDEGKSWELIGLEDLLPRKIFYDKYGNLIVGTVRKGVFISHN